MKIDLPGTCPHCGSDVVVTSYECPRCGTHTQGQFTPCPFCRLGADENRILFSFLVARGNLKEMEKDLGLSYPTLRGRLEALLERLGVGSRPTSSPPFVYTEAAAKAREDPDNRISGVLEQLQRGEIIVIEALERIHYIKSNPDVKQGVEPEESTNDDIDAG